MGTAFDFAGDVMARSADFFADATFTAAAGGGPVSCRVAVNRADPAIAIGGHGAVLSPGWTLTVRQSEVPRPVRGDRFVVTGGPTLAVDSAQGDALQVFWKVTVRAVAS